MPTTMLPFLWLLATTTHLAAFAPPPATGLAPALVAAAPRADHLDLVAPASEPMPGEPEWPLIESDNDEETEDGEQLGIDIPAAARPAAPSLFGFITSNPHPTILPRSALRSPILRC